MTTEKTMAAAGEFLREYGKQYFIVASEALNIGRIKFDMVPVGKAGKNNISFYLTTEQMLSLCKEIISGVFSKKITADTGSYPSAYKYVTGTDGSLHLNIGGGKVGCRIQMQDASKKLGYIMAVSMESILVMARKYLVYTGYEPVTPGTYYSELVQAFEAGRKERSKFKQTIPDGVEETINVTESPVDDEEASASKEPKPVEKNEPAKKKKEPSKPNNEFKVNVKGKKTVKNGFYSFEGKTEDGESVSLLFRKSDAESLRWFEAFEKKAETGASIDVLGEKKDNFILYSGVPSKKS